MNIIQDLSMTDMALTVIFLAFVMAMVSGITWANGGDTTRFRESVLVYLVVTLCMVVAALLSRGG